MIISKIAGPLVLGAGSPGSPNPLWSAEPRAAEGIRTTVVPAPILKLCKDEEPLGLIPSHKSFTPRLRLHRPLQTPPESAMLPSNCQDVCCWQLWGVCVYVCKHIFRFCIFAASTLPPLNNGTYDGKGPRSWVLIQWWQEQIAAAKRCRLGSIRERVELLSENPVLIPLIVSGQFSKCFI